MIEKTNIPFENFTDYDQAEAYIEAVRAEYRDGNANYSGQRNNEELQLIAEVTSDEARNIVDGALLGMMSLTGAAISEITDEHIEQSKIGVIEGKERGEPDRPFDFAHYRSEFERLLVGFAIITHRLHDKGVDIPSYADMTGKDRMQVASALFYDFQAHNALRFGVDTAGVKKTEFKNQHTDDGGIEKVTITSDKDKAFTEQGVRANMLRRNYATEPATHVAGKISVQEYKNLRNEFPENDKDRFDNDASFRKNFREDLENRG